MNKIGKFRVTSGRIRVTDPCYLTGAADAGPKQGTDHLLGSGIQVLPARDGEWQAWVTVLPARVTGWGDRVARLIVSHVESKHAAVERLDSICVDSGQAGVFDDGLFPREPSQFNYDDDTCFYKTVCDMTCDDDGPGGGTVEFGAVSSSGFGDGSYALYVGRIDGPGSAVAAGEIVFIGVDDDEDELDDDYDDEDEEDDDDDEEDDDGEGEADGEGGEA